MKAVLPQTYLRLLNLQKLEEYAHIHERNKNVLRPGTCHLIAQPLVGNIECEGMVESVRKLYLQSCSQQFREPVGLAMVTKGFETLEQQRKKE
jgi:hypothetical protein